MARTKQTGVSPNLQSSVAVNCVDLSANLEDLGDPPHLDPAVEMADVSAIENTANEPSLEDTRKCENINFAINQLVQTNNVIFALEAKLNTIPLFPHCYGPNEMEEVRKELIRFKEERTRNQGDARHIVGKYCLLKNMSNGSVPVRFQTYKCLSIQP
ncbi:hypothetical protein NPIL_206061 [Nephila pilipes]|uniref:Uncharacterized protein n=1 Tax=Nephila pilipes TaxID=299642 RepID=A0A8X6PH12_NEPPI|nr:hypothetical protein NPIL_206061 [Nephila pilipes]